MPNLLVIPIYFILQLFYKPRPNILGFLKFTKVNLLKRRHFSSHLFLNQLFIVEYRTLRYLRFDYFVPAFSDWFYYTLSQLRLEMVQSVLKGLFANLRALGLVVKIDIGRSLNSNCACSSSFRNDTLDAWRMDRSNGKLYLLLLIDNRLVWF